MSIKGNSISIKGNSISIKGNLKYIKGMHATYPRFSVIVCVPESVQDAKNIP